MDPSRHPPLPQSHSPSPPQQTKEFELRSISPSQCNYVNKIDGRREEMNGNGYHDKHYKSPGFVNPRGRRSSSSDESDFQTKLAKDWKDFDDENQICREKNKAGGHVNHVDRHSSPKANQNNHVSLLEDYVAKQEAIHEQLHRYHSAPPTPLDSVNTVPDDFGFNSTSPHTIRKSQPNPNSSGNPKQSAYNCTSRSGQTQQHRPQIVLSKQQPSAGALLDPNQNMNKSGASTGMWNKVTKPSGRDSSPMNKLSDLFKGAFSKF